MDGSSDDISSLSGSGPSVASAIRCVRGWRSFPDFSWRRAQMALGAQSVVPSCAHSGDRYRCRPIMVRRHMPAHKTRKRLAGASQWQGVRRQLYCALVAGHSLLQRAGLGVCRLLHGFWGAGISKLGYSPAHALQQAK